MPYLYRPYNTHPQMPPLWITFGGPDAADFLNRISTADIKKLKLHCGTPACILNGTGKIQAYFTLWRHDPTEFGLELAMGPTQEWKSRLLDTIERFHFGEQIAITPVEGLSCLWLLGDIPLGKIPQLRPFETIAVEDEIRLCHHGMKQFGVPLVTAWARTSRLEQWCDHHFSDLPALSFGDLEKLRIQQTRPSLGSEITGEVMPLEIGLSDAIGRNKGCYPGQEVIERIFTYGSPAWRLVRFEGSGESAPQVNSELFTAADTADSVTQIGKCTSLHQENGKFLGLGYVRKIYAKEGLEIRYASNSVNGRAMITAVAPYDE